ncbi:MAG: Spy/CpxP family protein refolding chaperone [Gammaproteobacteria bacterium]|nr:Spy/CpxP family protein refolding chaperone [Gammaproteobacteria bacterium]MBU1481923.1 Spy/CpxP family protein refolding chaperone [Gammaproteobacteria bacterium]
MQDANPHAHPPVSAGLMLSILPYVLASVVLCALPLISFALPPSSSAPPACKHSDAPRIQDGETPPPPLERPALPPYLSGIDMTEAQEDMLFKLMHDKAPAIFENEKIARKTRQQLHQLTGSDRFDAAKARSLADAHGQALAELAYLHTVIQAQIWALLSEVQRTQVSRQPGHPRKN